MAMIGVVRTIDDLGRLVIPMDIRKRLEWANGTPLQCVIEDDDRVVLTRYVPCCVFCSGLTNLIRHHGRYVCGNCIQELAQGE